MFYSSAFSLTSAPTSPHDAALLSSLLLRTVAVCAQVTGKAFDQLLQLLIYPLMQKLGHSSTMVSGDALVTLKTICSHCGYRLVLSIAIFPFCNLIPMVSFP